MDVLEEAKEIMEKVGCEKAFAVYGLDLDNIAEVRSCNEKGEAIELERDVGKLVSTMERKLVLDQEKPIECPINSSMDKYLEFFLKNRNITSCNLDSEECEKIEEKISTVHPNIILEPVIKVNNICATAKLSAEFALDDVKTSIILENEIATHLNESDQLIAIHPSKKEKEGKIKYITDSKLSYRFRDSGIKVEFYKSGKIVIRGVREERGINETVKKLSNYLFLKPFIYHSAG